MLEYGIERLAPAVIEVEAWTENLHHCGFCRLRGRPDEAAGKFKLRVPLASQKEDLMRCQTHIQSAGHSKAAALAEQEIRFAVSV